MVHISELGFWSVWYHSVGSWPCLVCPPVWCGSGTTGVCLVLDWENRIFPVEVQIGHTCVVWNLARDCRTLTQWYHFSSRYKTVSVVVWNYYSSTSLSLLMTLDCVPRLWHWTVQDRLLPLTWGDDSLSIYIHPKTTYVLDLVVGASSEVVQPTMVVSRTINAHDSVNSKFCKTTTTGSASLAYSSLKLHLKTYTVDY